MRTEPISVLVCALGGEGGAVLTDWLMQVARHAGYPAQASSVPGVAQRTGATTYYLEVCPLRADHPTLAGQTPVFSLHPVPGALDLLLSSELLEAARQVAAGLCSPARTRIISSSARALTTQERMEPGDGRADAAQLQALLAAHAAHTQVLDMPALAREAGAVVSAVLLGCLAASEVLPFARRDYEAVLQGDSDAARANQRGFALAWAALRGPEPAPSADAASTPRSGRPATPLSDVEKSRFAPELHEWIALAHDRVCAYQSAGYGQRYLDRLAAVADLERQAMSAPDSDHPPEESAKADGALNWPVTHEVARWLALWMAYDDVIRVAALKLQRSRWERVQREVRVREDDLLRLFDHFKPGVPELAGLLPTRWAERALAWDRSRAARGLAPWSIPIRLASHSVGGVLALRLLAALRPLRPLGSRFEQEQALIDEWLSAVRQGLAAHPALGLELARMGRLIKGYGATNERGKEHLLHLIRHAPHAGDPERTATLLRAAREAALQDDSGRALDARLSAAGMPERPVREQPIQWFPKRPSRRPLP